MRFGESLFRAQGTECKTREQLQSTTAVHA
jgi:hypothetical protein